MASSRQSLRRGLKRADTAYARTHAGRLEPLLGGRFISADQYQEAVTKARSLDAAVQHAQSQLAQQEELLAQQGDVNGRLETAKARVRLAELNVEYCYVRAPFKGLAGNQSQYYRRSSRAWRRRRTSSAIPAAPFTAPLFGPSIWWILLPLIRADPL